jgi:hypothetical protein
MLQIINLKKPICYLKNLKDVDVKNYKLKTYLLLKKFKWLICYITKVKLKDHILSKVYLQDNNKWHLLLIK